MVKTLLDRGADPNIRDEGDNAFPIHFAAERGDLPIVKLLIEHGADPIGAGTGHELDVLGWAVCFDVRDRTRRRAVPPRARRESTRSSQPSRWASRR